jgi:hypothetical protein
VYGRGRLLLSFRGFDDSVRQGACWGYGEVWLRGNGRG